jgi:hypothetical protein
MTLTFGGGISIGPGITITLPITATAGNTTSVSVIQNTAIASFNPFASVINGAQPYTYFVSAGTLPTGITINSSTGLVSGTPTVTYSTANVTFSVKDSNEVIAETTSTVAFTVNASISATAGATSTVSGYQNSAITSFNPFSSVTGGTIPYTYFVSAGTLPTGVTINSSTGQVSGTPNATYTTANVTFSVRDVNNVTAATTSTVAFTVNAALTATAGATASVSAQQNVAITSFNPFSSVTGGFTPYTYFVSAGTLPTGITIDSSTGLVSGTPTATYSTANVTFSVRDVNNVTAATTRIVSFAVAGASYSINYLIVAGGGAGGSAFNLGFAGGGGGAGGLLAGSACFASGGAITINVGAGAVGGAPAPVQGANSTIQSPTVPLITAIGGGLGVGQNQFCPAGYPGGSGGGSYWTNTAGSGTPGQGFPGGPGSPLSPRASGGGGAGGAGTRAMPTVSGSGGPGVIWPFTGARYAGGGGGGGGATGPGPGGLGGGGNGAAPGGVGSPGTAGTGGGGGGAAYNQPVTRNGGSGGPGVVILAVPTPNYPGVAPGAAVSNPPAAPGRTVLTYTTPNPTTPGTFTFTA